MTEEAMPGAVGSDLLGVYDEALPPVYGYLLSRCGRVALAEDLTAETLLTAVDAVTTMTVLVRHSCREDRDGHTASGMESGMQISLNRLEDLVTPVR